MEDLDRFTQTSLSLVAALQKNDAHKDLVSELAVAQMAELDRKIQIQKTENTQLQAVMYGIQNEINRMEEKAKELTQRELQLGMQNRALETQSRQFSVVQNKLETQLQLITIQHQRNAEEASVLNSFDQQKIQKLQVDVLEVQQGSQNELVRTNLRIGEIQLQVERERAAFMDQKNEQQKKLAEAESSLQKVSVEVNQLESNIAVRNQQMKAEQQKLRREIIFQQEAGSSLSQQLQKAITLLKEKEQNIQQTQLEKENENLAVSAAEMRLQAENDAIRKKNADIQKKINETEQETTAKNDQNGKLMRQRAELEEAISSIQKELMAEKEAHELDREFRFMLAQKEAIIQRLKLTERQNAEKLLDLQQKIVEHEERARASEMVAITTKENQELRQEEIQLKSVVKNLRMAIGRDAPVIEKLAPASPMRVTRTLAAIKK